MLLLLFFIACDQTKKTEWVSSVEVSEQDTLVQKDTEEQIAEIEKLIDITFEDPQQVILQPDSFINQIKILPHSVLGRETYAWLLLNIGYVLREHGSILSSIRFYERALDYCTVHNLSQLDVVLYIAKPLANLYTRIDDVEKSIALHEKAIQMSLQNNRQEYLPSLYNNLAIAYEQKNDVEQVFENCRKGLSFAKNESIFHALLTNTLAKAYLETNNIDSARFFNEKAIRLFKTHKLKEDTLIWYGAALKLNSDIAVFQNNYPQALKSLDMVVQLTESHFSNSKQREKAKYRLARGILTVVNNPQSAIQDFRFAKDLLELDSLPSYVSDYTYTHTLRGLANAYHQTNPDSALYYYRRAIENDYKTQQLIVSKASNYKNSKWNREILKEYVVLLVDVYNAEAKKETKQLLALQLFWAIELSKGRQVEREINRSQNWVSKDISKEGEELRNELQNLSQQLARSVDQRTTSQLENKISELSFQFQMSEKYFEQSFKLIDFDDFMRFIVEKSKSKSLVSYLIQNDGLSYIVSVSDAIANVFTIDQHLLKKSNSAQFIEDYFGETPYIYENNPNLYAERAEKIAQVFMPYMSKAKHELVVSPDGPLFKLPLDALFYQNRFILENSTLSYTYSFILNYLYQTEQIYSSDVLFFARSKHEEGFRNLDFVEEEKKEIADRFSGKAFEEEKANVKSFIAQLENEDVLHLATHAVSDEQPYLLFENRLTLDGLSVVVMKAPLVVLSACESADGKIIQAEGLESLNKAFISKGVKGVIAAQWPVDDQSVAQLMGIFYQELYNFTDPIKALTMAKRKFILEKEANYRNPWYWASMNYVGVDTEIQLKKKKAIWVWAIPFIMLLIALFIVYKKTFENRKVPKR